MSKVESMRKANIDYPFAAALAGRNAMNLIRHTETHYSLRKGDWILHLYPSNGRVYSDRGRPGAPRLDLKHGWTLIEAIEQVIARMDKPKPMSKVMQDDPRKAVEPTTFPNTLRDRSGTPWNITPELFLISAGANVILLLLAAILAYVCTR